MYRTRHRERRAQHMTPRGGEKQEHPLGTARVEDKCLCPTSLKSLRTDGPAKRVRNGLVTQPKNENL